MAIESLTPRWLALSCLPARSWTPKKELTLPLHRLILETVSPWRPLMRGSIMTRISGLRSLTRSRTTHRKSLCFALWQFHTLIEKIENKRKKEPELTERQASEGWVISPFSFISYKVIKHNFLIQTQRFQLGQGTGLDSSSLRGFHNLRNGALYRGKPPMSSFVWEFLWWFISRANTMYWGHIQGNGRRGGQWINKRVVVASGDVAESAWLCLWSTLVVILGVSVGLLVASFIGAACAWLGGLIRKTQDRGQQMSEWFPRRCRFSFSKFDQVAVSRIPAIT